MKRFKQFDLKLILLALILSLLVRKFLFFIVTVPTDSMQPTLNNDKHYIVSKVYKNINRGDIIVFTKPGEHIQYVKRVIGLPGEHIVIDDGKVYIDGDFIQEDYVKYPGGIDNYVMDIAPGEYFLMGDNRANSKDSRYWDFHTIPYKGIKGIVLKK